MIALNDHPHGNCFLGLGQYVSNGALGEQRDQSKGWWQDQAWGLTFRDHKQESQSTGWGKGKRSARAHPAEPNLRELWEEQAVPIFPSVVSAQGQPAGPLAPARHVSVSTARGARICCWRCPSRRTLKCECVSVCECVNLRPSLPSFKPWPGACALTCLSSLYFPTWLIF